MNWGIAAQLAGGLGLFLLGMGMLTDGLRLAAGPALERILRAATRTRWHALGSGVLVTALVQSSSVVTVAAIGFVNAGLLGLAPALWVLFGSNVGTTMTGWIVATVGLKLKIEALALPVIGLGVALRVSGEQLRRGAVGTALAGFGLLFLGIGLLQSSFTDAASHMQLPQGTGPLAVLAQVAAGALLTVMMQSSSATLAVALTAAQGGLLDPQGGAALVIGANLGTTVKAVLATLAATANARRVAAGHVIFNFVTAGAALLLLPWFVGAIEAGMAAAGLGSDPATRLALFHTTFNVLGVLLMWPLAGRLAAWLQRRFTAREENEARPRYLDDTVLAVPALAVDALVQEGARLGHMAVRLARAVLAGGEAGAVAREAKVFEALQGAAESFVERIHRGAMSADSAARLPLVLRVLRYHESVVEQAQLAAALGGARAQAQAEAQAFARAADALLAACDPLTPAMPDEELAALLHGMEQAYEPLKAGLLSAGAAGALPIAAMEEAMRRYSALRRAAQQAYKARRRAAAA